MYALRVENGHPLWSDSLASFHRVDSVSSLPHIRARPVIDRDLVFLVSHSGRTSALDLRTGKALWSRDFGGIQSPAVAGDFVFLITTDNELVCLTRRSGLVRWTKVLPQFENPEDNRGKLVWNGPVIINSQLILTGSNGTLLTLNAADGSEVCHHQLPDKALIPPVVANKTVYVLTDDGTLVAYR